MHHKKITRKPEEPEKEEPEKEFGPESLNRKAASYTEASVAGLQRRVGNRATFRILAAAEYG